MRDISYDSYGKGILKWLLPTSFRAKIFCPSRIEYSSSIAASSPEMVMLEGLFEQATTAFPLVKAAKNGRDSSFESPTAIIDPLIIPFSAKLAEATPRKYATRIASSRLSAPMA